MIEFIVKPITFPCWQVLLMLLYMLIAHTYTTYRLAQTKEIDGIFNKLAISITSIIRFLFATPPKKKQYNGIKNQHYEGNSKYISKKHINRDCNNETDKPIDNPSHSEIINRGTN